MARVRLISGGPRSDRAAQVDSLLLERLPDSLLIVPTGAYARRRAAALLTRSRRAGLLDPPVITFGELADRTLQGSELRARDVSPLEQRILLARAAAQARRQGVLESLGAAADSEGFLSHLLSVIYELKQAAIEPKQFRRYVRGRRTAMDGIVADVYAAYQDELKNAGMVDLPGKYWLARIECEKSIRPRGLGTVRRILFDDFDDFTPSEFGVVKALAGHADEVVFGINVNPDPEQQSLYAAPLQTIAKVRDAFESANFDEPLFEPAARRQSEFIGATLLVRKTLPAPAHLESDVEFVECHTLEHEIETIARRIKDLVRRENAALANIAVVWRSTAAASAPMREIFREFGVPLSGLETRSLDESAIAGFILRFMDAAQTWAAGGVLDVLTSPWFSGPKAAHAGAYPILVRAARVGPHEAGWRSGVDRLGKYLLDPGQIELKRLNEHVPHAREACAALAGAVSRLAEQAKSMSGSATIRGRIELLEKLFEQWAFSETLAAMPAGAEREFEEAAMPAVLQTLAVLREGHAADPERTDLAAFAKLLRRAWAVSSVQVQTPSGVSCLEMEPARYLQFDYVFLAGLTDAQVPAGRRQSAIYSEDDRRELADAGVALDRADAHNEREILLFQRMFAIARRRIFASWHRLAPGGSAVQRSLYLSEIADRLGGLREATARSPREVLVPHPQFAACARDVQNIAVPGAAQGHYPGYAAAARIESSRYGFGAFDAHDGVLGTDENLRELAQRYDASHEFSASQLEKYTECPFQFFQERVLRLFVIEAPEHAFDHLARGSVLHAALEAFHRDYLGKGLAEIPEDEAAAAMTAAGGKAFDDAARHLRSVSPGLLAAERMRTLSTLHRHLRLMRAAEDAEPWLPIRLEQAFGGTSGAPAFALDLGDQSIRLAGRIDRIDESTDSHRLIDYKTSKVAPKSITRGKAFQLALYALACEAAILPDCAVERAVYIAVGKKDGATVALSRTGKDPNWDERMNTAREAVVRAVAGIRAGRFHPARDTERCRGCPEEKVCRFERARVQRKTTS